MRIEFASREDAPAILALQKLAYGSEAALYNDEQIPPLTQTLDELFHEWDELVILKAEMEGQLVGSVRARVAEGSCHIGRLIVHPAWQGRGIGTRLMAAIEERCADVARFELFTGERSVRNLALYGRLGYQEFRRERVNGVLTVVYLEKIKEQRWTN